MKAIKENVFYLVVMALIVLIVVTFIFSYTGIIRVGGNVHQLGDQISHLLDIGTKKSIFISKNKDLVKKINPKIDDLEIITMLSAVYDNCYILNLDADLVLALIEQESNFTRTALSDKDARGYMQVIPPTAELVAAKMGKVSYDLYNTQDNISIGCYYLATLLHYYPGEIALAAYYAGSRIHLGKDYALEVKQKREKYAG